MRLHVKLKEFLSMFFMAILFFPAFNASLFFTGVKPLYSIIKCSTEIFYDWRGNDSNLLIVFYVQIMPDDFVMQLHRF
ncbi:hypothetical protein AF43_00211 [Escherichia coli MGH 57]|nr:hypothetical protein AF43_00211 [Escherichia coli MGH 57]